MNILLITLITNNKLCNIRQKKRKTRVATQIEAHIAISFIVFSLVRHLEYRLKLYWYNYSPNVIREELLKVQWSIIFDKINPKKKWFLPSNISSIWESIYKVMGKKWLRIVQDII